jgi:replicative DNA helicase
MARTAEDVRRIPPGRDIPSNQEAEQSVLGSMMLSTEAVAEVIEEIKADDFYWSKHRRIYDALVHLYSRGEPVDQVTAVEELKRRGQLEEVGALYIHELVANVPTPASARYYAKIVHELALLRRLIDAAGKIMELAFGSPEDPESVADHAEELIYSVARRDQKDEVVVVRSLVDQTMEELEHIHQRESAYSGIPSGFRDLDELLSGLQKSNLIVVAARPGVGKSSFVTNLVRNVTVEGTPAALFSLEMSRWEIGMRLLCGEARVPWDRVRAARVSGDDWSRIAEAAEVLHDLPLWIVDSGNVTILDVRAKARRLKAQRGLGLIVVDYLQLMTHHSGRADNRQQEVAEISRGLKLLAKELEIPVIAVSQLNRDPERRQDKRPQLSDLRECVTGDTLVALAEGRHVPIRDLVGTTPEVLAVTHDRRIVPAQSDLVWSVGTRPVYRIRLSSGREVRATTLHRFLGAEGWVRVKELRVGTRMAVARRVPEPARPERWPEDRVVLLGQLIAHDVDPSSIDSIGGRANREVAHLALRRSFAGAGVAERWLSDLGAPNSRSTRRRIPHPAFRLPNDQVALLLRHLWAGSGSIYVPSTEVRPAVFFSCSSGPLARDVAALLGRLGILASIRTARETGVRPVHSVHVVGERDQRTFLNTVGAFGDLASPALRLGAELEEPPVQVSFEDMAREEPDPEADSAPVRSSSRSSGTLTVEWAPASVATLTAQAEPQAASDVEDDVCWDVVEAIEPIGEEEVFDLTVPGPASWLADGVVSHNSGAIEQDSDIVVFIHRDDAEESTKNVAELIVAKHRNGPTGQVKLTFLPNLTQFRNYASGT